MRILLLADINSSHLQRWAIGLAQKGVKVGVWSLAKPRNDWFTKYQIAHLGSGTSGGFAGKFSYFFAASNAKKAIEEFKPDVVHAHYASSYGMIGRKCGFHPFFLSVWGSDITEFPRGFIRRSILHKNLQAADAVFATSHFLSDILEKQWNVKANIVPFGIDMQQFRDEKVSQYFSSKDIVVGTVKALESIYGIHLLIAAFTMVQKKRTDLPLRLLIAGDGSMRNALMRQAQVDAFPDTVRFTGRIPYEQVPSIHQEIDVFVNVSYYESFGVSVLEASSCGKPVIVSATGGLPEVVDHGKSGFLVQGGSPVQIAETLERLVENVALRQQMGANGRAFVASHYDWNTILDEMVNYYSKAVSQ